ncbi:type IV secretion system protein [Pseudomonas quasicaspiana]|nr:type IV secretion system protein [Pseudomonas syringae]MDG6401296.1 type IV secretion system protein [Pseudomonas quasicaspiana]
MFLEMLLLLFKFTMAFLIGVGPIFILALMFDATKELFRKWLFYVSGTLFSMIHAIGGLGHRAQAFLQGGHSTWVAKNLNSHWAMTWKT